MKNFLKIVITIFVFVLLVFIVMCIRNAVIMNQLEKLATKTANTTNYSYTITHYDIANSLLRDYTTFCKGNESLVTMKNWNDPEKKIIVYTNNQETINQVIENGVVKSTTATPISGSNSSAIPFKLNELGVNFYSYFKNPFYVFSTSITTDTCNSQECYFIQTSNKNKTWVNKQTGIVVRQISENGSITDYSYLTNQVTDQNIAKPNTNNT